MTAMPPCDRDALCSKLYTAVVADVLDLLGLREQVVRARLKRCSGQGLLIGPAKTTQWEETGYADPHPYELELKAVDECQPGQVLVAAAGGSTSSGVWGELLSTAAQKRGCAGVIVDGAVRDVARMDAMGFLCFAAATSPLDSRDRQRVTAIDVPVEVGGVVVAPGDLVLADQDGVVIVPRAVEAEALARAWEKVTAENRVRDEIRAGAKTGEVFRKYGVL